MEEKTYAKYSVNRPNSNKSRRWSCR